MKNFILSVAVLWLCISEITGHSLSKIKLEKPSNLVYKIKEDKDGATLQIKGTQMNKPTLREITYYHIIERPYKMKWMNEDPSNEDQPTFEEIRRFFTNGPGFQYGRVKPTYSPSTDKNKTNKHPINDGTNQIDIRHGGAETSKLDQSNIDFPQERAENKDNAASKRRKRDIRYETSVSKKEKRENNVLRDTGLPVLPSQQYMNEQPAFTNVPSSIGDMVLNSNKDANPSLGFNGIVPGPITWPYGMDFTGNTGNYWNNFNDPYNVFHSGGDQSFNSEVHSTAEPPRNQPTPNNISSSPNGSEKGINKEINGSSDSNANPINSKDQGLKENFDNIQGSRYPGNIINPDSRETDDSRDSGYWSDESSRESGDRSGEDSRSGSDEDRSGEYSGSSSRESDSRESDERDSRKHKHAGVRGSKEANHKGKSEKYTDEKEETKKKFDQILSDLHNIFVKSNATVIVPGSNSNLVGYKDAPNDAADNNGTKKANMISVLEGLFTNIIRNTIIVNNNVPVIQNPGVNPANDASNPDTPLKFHDYVDTTTNSGITTTTVTNLNSFKDTTDNPSKTGDSKPDEIRPDLQNGNGRPDEVTTFNATKLPNNIDKELNKNETINKGENNVKSPSSTEQPNEDKDKLNKGDNKVDDNKSNKTADEKKTNKIEGDDSKKHVNATETPVAGHKDNDNPANNKDNKDAGGKNTNLNQMMDLMNNDNFWKFMGDFSAKYVESLVERTNKFMKEEIAANIDKYLKEHKPEADNKEILPKRDEDTNKGTGKKDKDIDETNNVIEKTNEANTTENPIAKTDKGDAKETHRKNIVHVKSHTIYGNAVGNDKVTNIYAFYGSKNLDEIMKHIKDLVKGNNNTNIFNFVPHSNKHDQVKDDNKHSDGKHNGNESEITDNVTNTETNTGDTVTVTKEPFTNKDNSKNTTLSNVTDTVTESNIEKPGTTDSSSNSTSKIENTTKFNNVTTEIAHNTTGTDVSINSNKEEVTTESTNNETSTVSNNITEKANNNVTTPSIPTATINNTEAVTTEKADNTTINNDNKNVTTNVEDKKTDQNATTVANNSSNSTDVSTENPTNKTTTEIPNNGTSSDKVETSTKNETAKSSQIDVSTTKPNVTENKAENVTEHTGNLTSTDVTTSNTSLISATKDAVNSTKNSTTEVTNSNNENKTDDSVIEKPETDKNSTGKAENDIKITPEKDVSSNKTSDSNEIDSHNNKTTESSSTTANSTENTAGKNNTSTDLKPDNNTGSTEHPKNNSEKSADEHKDENSKDKSEDKKVNSEDKINKKENSENKDSSTKKSTDEATTEKH